jgi:hypothetical protein
MLPSTMTVARMCEQIGAIHYRPGWSFKATDYTKRFEQGCQVTVRFPAPNTNQDLAKLGYPQMIDVEANFVLRLCDCATTEDLCYQILEIIAQVDRHEAREFLRVGTDFEAPFHPHRLDGMARYARLAHPGVEVLSLAYDESYGK